MDLKGKLREGMRKDESKEHKDHWRFSDLGKCLRFQVMKRAGVKGAEHSDSTLFVFKMGHLIEKQALDWLYLSGVDILAKQITVEAPDFDAKGHADALVRWGNQIVVVEVKSTRNKALEYRIPYPNHKKQASAYALYLNLPYAWLLYIGRDGAVEQALVMAKEEQAAIEQEWRELNEYWKPIPEALEVIKNNRGEPSPDWFEHVGVSLPPRKPKTEVEYKRAGPWGPKGTKKIELDPECGYCQYQKVCWGRNETGALPEEAGRGADGETEEATEIAGRGEG